MSRFAAIQELIARRDPALALHGLSAVLVVVLAVQVVRIGWATAAPVGPIGEAAPALARAPATADFALLDRFDPFFRTASATPAAAADSANLRLFGVRTGARSSAIIGRSDGRQVSVVVGEEVAPGIVLRTVAADHVELTVQGRRARLAFSPSAAGAAPYTPPPMVQPAVASPASGATVSPAAAGAAELARAGLQPGDVVISVNGQSVSDTQSVEALGRDLAGGREAVVQYQRDGQVRTATLRIPEL